MWAILNEKKEVVVTDMLNPKLDEAMQDKVSRRVADSRNSKHRVSTVFLGLDHSFDGSPPLWFETMVFDLTSDRPFKDLDMDRYTTWDEAAAGHKIMCEKWKVPCG